MHTKIFLFLGMFAALATNSFAQPAESQSVADLSLNDIPLVNNLTRPRIVRVIHPNVVVKASAVEASVIVNTVSLEQAAFDLLNQKRFENGLKPLAWNEELATIARLHSGNMARLSFFSHRGIDGKMVSDRADDEGLTKWRAIGENIAFNRGYNDPIGRAVELWLDSSSHRRNLLDSNWKETAVGIAVTPDGEYYLTQVFLKK